TACAQAERLFVKGDFVAVVDAIRELYLDLFEPDRRRERDARVRGAASEFGDRDEWLTRERRGLIDIASAPVRECERTIPAVFRDAIGIGERKDRADVHVASLSAFCHHFR